MFNRKNFPWLFASLVIISVVLISGCTIRSGPKEFPGREYVKEAPAPEAPQKLTRSFAKTDEEGIRFMFSGHAVTKIQKRNTGLYFSGGYDKEKGYNVDGTIFGQPFRFYRWGNNAYISEGDKWRKIDPVKTPFAPFADFKKLQFLADKAVKLPDGEVLGKKCDVYRITLGKDDALKALKAMGFVDLMKDAASDTYFDRVEMVFTIWVGKEDDYIYQYITETTMPVPSAGSLYQEVYVRFWDYNSTSVNLQTPDKLEPYLIKE